MASPRTWRTVRCGSSRVRMAGCSWLRGVAVRHGPRSGEAAGRLDPAWGQGLVTAVVSGIAAGRTAAACLADPARESVYLAAYDGWFADRIHAAAATLRKRYTDNRINLAATGEGQQ